MDKIGERGRRKKTMEQGKEEVRTKINEEEKKGQKKTH